LCPIFGFKLDTIGVLTRIAGSGIQGDSGDGGPATSAKLHDPAAVAVDPSGNLFIADSMVGRIRKVTPDGTISTVAGTGNSCCYNDGAGDDGPALKAQLFYPYQLAVDATGVYIAEWNTSQIRKVSLHGTIRTVVGTGAYGYSGDGGPASAAQIGAAWGMTFDRSGSLYFSDAIPGDDIEPAVTHVRKVTQDGIITTIAASGAVGFGGDGGPALNAQFYAPGRSPSTRPAMFLSPTALESAKSPQTARSTPSPETVIPATRETVDRRQTRNCRVPIKVRACHSPRTQRAICTSRTRETIGYERSRWIDRSILLPVTGFIVATQGMAGPRFILG